MLFDHVGYVFFPEAEWMRVIGRLTMPIFAYAIARGFYYTSNRKKYLIRLSALAIISQVPFMLTFHEGWTLNTIFPWAITVAVLMAPLWAIPLVSTFGLISSNGLHFIGYSFAGFYLSFLVQREASGSSAVEHGPGAFIYCVHFGSHPMVRVTCDTVDLDSRAVRRKSSIEQMGFLLLLPGSFDGYLGRLFACLDKIAIFPVDSLNLIVGETLRKSVVVVVTEVEF